MSIFIQTQHPRGRYHTGATGRCQVCDGTFRTYKGALFREVCPHGWRGQPRTDLCEGSNRRPYPFGIDMLRTKHDLSIASAPQRARLLHWRYAQGPRIQLREFLPYIDKANFRCLLHPEPLIEGLKNDLVLNVLGIEIVDWLEDGSRGCVVLTPDFRGTELYFALDTDAVHYRLRWS